MLRTYTVSRAGLRNLLWRSARLSFAITLLLIAIALRMRLTEHEMDPATVLWIGLYLLSVLIGGTWLIMRSTRRVWTSYRLDLSDEDLRRTQYRLPEMRISRPEITNVEEMPGRGMVVRTADSDRFIFVPAGLAGYTDVRDELSSWAPFHRLSQRVTWQRQWFGITAALMIVGWMVATLKSDAAGFVIPSAFLISVFLLWSFIAAQRSLHLDRRTKIAMCFVIFPILALTLKTTQILAVLAQPQ